MEVCHRKTQIDIVYKFRGSRNVERVVIREATNVVWFFNINWKNLRCFFSLISGLFTYEKEEVGRKSNGESINLLSIASGPP